MGSGCIQCLLAAFTSWEEKAVKEQHCLELRLKQPVCGLCAAVCLSGALNVGRNMHLAPGRRDRCGRCTSVCPASILELEGFLIMIIETVTRRVERELRELAFTCSKARQCLASEVVTVPYLCSVRTGYLVYWASLEDFYVSVCCGCSIAACLLHVLESPENIAIPSLRYQQVLVAGTAEGSWGSEVPLYEV